MVGRDFVEPPLPRSGGFQTADGDLEIAVTSETASGNACPTIHSRIRHGSAHGRAYRTSVIKPNHSAEKVAGPARRFPEAVQSGRQKRPSYNLLAKPRIEVETAGIFNFDFVELLVFRIEEKRSLSRHNHTRNGKNHGVT